MSTALGAVASVTARAGRSVARQVRSALDPSAARPAGPGRSSSGWLAVTVAREPAEVDATDLPAPLADLGRRIEVRVQPAPGGKGTELAARLHGRSASGTDPGRLTGGDPEADVRSALREAKQLIEVGEVLVVDPVPHGKRTATPGGALLEAWTKAAPGAGVR